MIIDRAQKGNILEISYTNKNGEVELAKYDIFKTNGVGVYDYEICDESDPEKEPILRHYKNNEPIKKVASKKFDFDEMREFLLKSLQKDESDKLFSMHSPNIYMCDIEIDTRDGDVFPSPTKAEFPIDSIQITGPNFSTLVLTCNDRVIQDRSQMIEVENAINEHYKDVHYVWTKVDRLKYAHIRFQTESEMIIYYWKLVREKLHAVSFWNGDGFDVPYLWNRCRILNIDMGLGSPTGEISQFNWWPKHRYVFDYMRLVIANGSDIDRTSFALEHCATEIIGVGKITKGGSYKDLYLGPIVKFLTYGAVDTISMQFMHSIKSYTTANDALVYYCHAGVFDASQVTALVHSLIWDELYEKGQINAIPHKKLDKVPYGGGYVKDPSYKFVIWIVLEDFSALYPRVMQSYNISFDNYVGKIRNDEHKKQLMKEGYIVTVNGNIYKNDKPYTLKIIETKLLQGRYQYKDMQMLVYMEASPAIDAEIKRRGL